MRSLEAELLHHATALRSMARALVGAQHTEDLVQETTLQALRRPQLRLLDATGLPMKGVSLFLHGPDCTVQHSTEPSDAEGEWHR